MAVERALRVGDDGQDVKDDKLRKRQADVPGVRVQDVALPLVAQLVAVVVSVPELVEDLGDVGVRLNRVVVVPDLNRAADEAARYHRLDRFLQ